MSRDTGAFSARSRRWAGWGLLGVLLLGVGCGRKPAESAEGGRAASPDAVSALLRGVEEKDGERALRHF